MPAFFPSLKNYLRTQLLSEGEREMCLAKGIRRAGVEGPSDDKTINESGVTKFGIKRSPVWLGQGAKFPLAEKAVR